MSDILAKSPNSYSPLHSLSHIPQMCYVGEGASPVTPVLPLEQLAGDKNAVYLCC